MILLTLKHLRPGILTMEEQDTEERAFSSMEKAEQWLADNGFYKGRRYWFNYADDYWDWCHQGEASWDYVDVEIKEYEMNMDLESRYKNFHFELPPWHRVEEEEEQEHGY